MYKILKYLLFLPYLLLGTASLLSAQERIDSFPSLEWYKVLAGYDQYDQVKDMEEGADGSIYYSGVYNSSLFVGIPYHADTFFQDTLVTAQHSHGYVVKVDSNGQFQWVWIIHGAADSRSVVSDIALAENGDLWAIGEFYGEVTFPYGGTFNNPVDNDGFAIRLSENGDGANFIRFSGDGRQYPQKIFLQKNGFLKVLFSQPSLPIYVGADTIEIDTSEHPFLGISTMDSSGNVVDFSYLKVSSGTGLVGYFQSDGDDNGNMYLLFRSIDPFSSDSVHILLGNDSISSLGWELVKISNDHKFMWHRPVQEIFSTEIVLDAVVDGEVYLSAGSVRGPDYYTFLEKYDSNGMLVWQVENSGYQVYSGGIAICKDFLYWTGRYRCDMNIDTIHFEIGERQPWPSPAETGYLSLINHHTGKVVWVMSDATTNQDKRFGAIVAAEDEYITVETRVITTLCTIDTLSLQVTSADVPYNMLLRFDGKQFPVWPVVPDPIPSFSLWPNPTQGAFTVQVDQSWGPQTRLEVYNLAGQKLWAQSIQAQEVFLEMENLSGQLLLIRIVDDGSGRRMTKKLVVLH